MNDTNPTTSAIPVATTNGSAARVIRNRPKRQQGRATRATPTKRAGRIAQTIGRTPAARPEPNRLIPKQTADPVARAAARIARSREIGTPSSSPPAEAARTTPRATRPRIGARPGARASPASVAMTAAMAPSVESIVAMIPTAPIR